MAQMNVAGAIAKLLETMGTEFVFGMNGHGNWALLDAIVHETKIRGIPVRAEDQAVHMADGYWRMKRQAPLAIVATSVGPGNMNIVSAVASAFYGSIAMLVLAGAGPTHWFDRGGMEESYRNGPEDWVAVLKPITKKAVLITRPDNALDMFLRAYQTAITGRPGPVVVQIPFDIQHSAAPDPLPDPLPYLQSYPPGPSLAGVKAAAALLATAQRPLIMVGSGVHSARAWDELLRFAEATETPVATTPTGKGAFPERHPLSLGCIGRAGTGHANEAARKCDLLIAIGTHLTDIDTGGWTLFDIPAKTRLVHIDIDPTELGRAYPTSVALPCDAAAGLAVLTEAVAQQERQPRAAWLATLADARRRWTEETAAQRTSDLAPLHYARICHDTAEVVGAVDPDMPVFFDTGHLLSFAPAFLSPMSRHVAHDGFFHRMGWSASAIIGASLAQGGRPALALLGDGSFLMGGLAVATAVEQNLPLVWVVLTNRSLQIERELMLKLYGRESFCDYRRSDTGEMWNPDVCLWAQAMGAGSARVTKPEDYAPTLRQALAARRPFVVDVEVNLDIQGYRSVWYPYPNNFYATWAPGPQR
jgi:acetolactate synthase-1/2/3 large subunit